MVKKKSKKKASKKKRPQREEPRGKPVKRVKATTAKKKTPVPRGNKKGFNAEEYVRTMAQRSQSGGCKVCCYPNVAKKLSEVIEHMDSQRVKIPATQLLRDFTKHYAGFKCSDEKFRKHIRECLERDL